MGNWYLPNGLVFRDNSLEAESVLILDGRITAFGADADRLRAGCGGLIRDFDAHNSLITRGFIDLHTHLREPGFEHKETIATGTRAAAAGGFTSVCPMPNTDPALDSVERLYDLQLRIVQSAEVKVHPIAALTCGRQGQKPVDYKSFRERKVRLFSDDGDPLEQGVAEEVFLGVREAGGILINHLEEKSLVGGGFFYKQIPAESEFLMLKRDLELVAKTGCRYHAAHVSCAQTVELIAEAKKAGLPVTAEATPHHLVLTYRDIGKPPGHFQMKPPLRSEKDRRAVCEGLKLGVIDIVATDHAPHGTEKERGLFPGSPFGVTGLETAFPVLYTHLVLTGQLSLERLLQSLTVAPARLLNIEGNLKVGTKADLAVIDLTTARKVVKANFKSKGTNSPFIGQTLRGWPKLTLVDGGERFVCEF